MKRWLFFLACLFALISAAHAFDYKGHIYLEQEAYKLLRNYPNGQVILDWLIQHEILSENLVSRSQYPDNAIERQFIQSRQGYHFMTSNYNVLQASKSTDKLSPEQRLLLRALAPNLQMVYYFFRELVENPKAASQAGRGVYVLMHIVADSYSTEHTSRDSASTQMLTIKGWKLSRFGWPRLARSMEPHKNTLLLLHHGRYAPGDHEWCIVNDKDTVLTAAGSNAAKAMCALLVAVYEANKDSTKADLLVCRFIEQYFRPYQSNVSERSFTFENISKKIKYNFGDHYEADKKSVILHYDRFPFYSFMFTAQTGFTKETLFKTFGAEIERYSSPRAADKSFALIRRTPIGYGFGVVYYSDRNLGSTVLSGLRFKTFISVSFALPLINASLDPHGGLGFYPAATATRFSPIAGFDLVWNPFKDFYFINAHPRTVRLALGYEYDPFNIFLANSIKLKLGYNTWHGRIVGPRGTKASQ